MIIGVQQNTAENGYFQSLYALRNLYAKLLAILETFCGSDSYMLTRDQNLNYCYILTNQEIDSILKQDGFRELSKSKPTLFEGLIEDIEEADLEWRYLSKDAYNFMGKIDEAFALSGANGFKMPHLEKFFLMTDEIISEHCKRGRKARQDILRKAGVIQENKKTETIQKPIHPILTARKGVGYFQFYKQGPKIKIGSPNTNKYRLLSALIKPLGTARTIESVFEDAIKNRVALDSRLKNNYLANSRQIDILQYTMKELQKINGLKGKVSLGTTPDGRAVWLKLVP